MFRLRVHAPEPEPQSTIDSRIGWFLERVKSGSQWHLAVRTH